MSTEGKKNAYFCESCQGYVITIDRDEGVTPMFLACRVKGDPKDAANDCDGRMTSTMYPDEPWPPEDGYGNAIPTEPTWEWYKPDAEETAKLEPGTREHVERGGLMLRQIEVSSGGV